MIRVRATRPEDLSGLSELFLDRFGHPLGADEWHWKYRQISAAGGEGRSAVAFAPTPGGGERIVAHAGALRLPATTAAGARGIWQLTDWAGTAAGGGLVPPLAVLGRRFLADLPGPAESGDAPWIFGFPSERHLRLGRHLFGYRPLPAIMPLAGRLPAVGGAAAGRSLEISDHCDAGAEAIWRACGVHGVRRTADFLNWRYHARPGRYYRFYRFRREAAAGGGAALPGLAVFGFAGDEARAVELWLPPAAPGAGGAAAWRPALEGIAADLAAIGLAGWRFWPPPPAASGLAALLAELGLAPSGPPQTMGWRGRGGARAAAGLPEPGFYYAMGDYDLV